MAKRIPGIFKKPIKEDQFNKKILRYIEQNADKEFLKNSFELKDGFYILQDLTDSKEDKKKFQKLKSLAKDIKAARSLPVNFIPLAGVSLLVAGSIVFFTIIMNPLLERIIEGALENVFEAKVDIKSFNLNPLRFKIGFRSLSIANSDEPMTNLLEMGRTEIRLLPAAVLRGKIYIEEVRADSLQFGGPRNSSGAIFTEEQLQKRREPPPKSSAPPLVDIEKFDAMALINQQYDKLKSPALYNDVSSLYTSGEAKWKTQVEDSQKTVADLQNKAKPFINFDINSIDVRNPQNIANVLKMVEDGKAMVSSVQSTVTQVQSIASGVEEDIKHIAALTRDAQNSVSEDFNYLKSFLDLAGGPYKEILETALQDILSGSAMQYIGYAKRFLYAANKLQAYQKEQETKKPKKIVYKGRDVQFPTVLYPKFYLGVFASDFTIKEWKSGFDLRDVSSNPNIIPRPTTLKINIDELGGAQKSFSATALADFREATPALFDVDVKAENIPFSLEKELVNVAEIGIGGFKGSAAFDARSSGMKNGNFTIGGAVALGDPSIVGAGGTLGNAIDEAVREAEHIDISFDFLHITDEKDKFIVESNLLSLIQASLKKAAAKYLAAAQAELEKALRSYISDFLKEKNISGADMGKIFDAAKGNRDTLNALQTNLQKKLTEMEAKAKGAANEKLDEVKDNATDAAKNAVKNALGGKFKF
ncbi:MAG: hypothetical protein Ta2G_00570 [Termitinemataceae bacterium]|nr:MAG: hypothetical protein Ta2G_00570 [Termitinemataceae bacterium]